MNRTLLVWESFGEDELRFFLLDADVAPDWLPECHGQYVGQADLSPEADYRLDTLSELVCSAPWEQYRVPADGTTLTEMGSVCVVVSGWIP